MGRPALGAAARDVTGSVRITRSEADIFKARYGSIGKFLKLKVDEELRRVADEREQQAGA